MQLKSIEIKDIFSIGKGRLEFKPGLFLLEGLNRDTGGSNGAGKSSLFRCITTALFEKNDINIVKDQIIRKGQKGGYVNLDFDNYKVIYARGKTEYRSGISLFENGKDISLGKDQDTKDKIEKLIGFDYDFLLNTYYIPQGKFLSFLTGTDKVRMQLLSSMLNLDKYDEIYVKVKAVEKDLNIKFQNSKYKVDSIEVELKSVNIDEVVKQIEAQSKDLESYEKLLKDKEVLAVSIDRRIQELKFGISSVKKLNSSLIEINDSIKELEGRIIGEVSQEVIKSLKDQVEAVKYKIIEGELHNKSIDIIKQTGICPVCKSKVHDVVEVIDLKDFQYELKNLQKKIDDSEKKNREIESNKLALSMLIKQKQDIEKNLNDFGNVDIQFMESELNKLALDKEALDVEISKIKSLYNKAQEEKGRLSAVISMYESRKLELDKEKTLVKQLEHSLKVYDYLSFIFSDKGFKKYIVEQSSEIINKFLNEYLTEISEGSLHGVFQPFRENKAGEVVNEFSFKCINQQGNILDFDELSGGEKQLVGLAMLLALWKYVSQSNKFNVLFLDEIFGALDGVNQYRVAKFLSGFEKDDTCIIVVTHQSQIKDMVDWSGVITIEKENGVSSVDFS